MKMCRKHSPLNRPTKHLFNNSWEHILKLTVHRKQTLESSHKYNTGLSKPLCHFPVHFVDLCCVIFLRT